jgi:hypothetical protein
MTATEQYVSVYERRVQTVREVIEGRTALEGSDATDLAERILSAIDHIPEKVR